MLFLPLYTFITQETKGVILTLTPSKGTISESFASCPHIFEFCFLICLSSQGINILTRGHNCFIKLEVEIATYPLQNSHDSESAGKEGDYSALRDN